MSRLGTLALALGTIAASAVAFDLALSRLAATGFVFASDPVLREELEASLADQRALAELDPASESQRRERFQAIAALLQRIEILERSREALIRRYRLLLAGVFVLAASVAVGGWAWREARLRPRLERLRLALARLAAGQSIEAPERRRDLIGRVEAMVVETSHVLGRQRARLAALENLSAWQEAARRHAHEMRTPLTALQLELDRLGSLVEELDEPRGQATLAVGSVRSELGRLADFTRRFTTFGRLPRPRREPLDLAALLAELVELYGAAWPHLTLALEVSGPLIVTGDRDMVRQVLVNLWENAAHALEGRSGRCVVCALREGAWAVIEVVDDGPGVAASVAARLFEPYTTSKGIGSGMGLGLAISRKIALDHGGDLELVEGRGPGACFRLRLPLESPAGKEER